MSGPKDWTPGKDRPIGDMRAYWDRLENLPSVAAIREALRPLPRRTLLEMLQWNDRNGCYLDHLARLEGFPPMTKEKAVDYVVWTVQENAWAADDPRREEMEQP